MENLTHKIDRNIPRINLKFFSIVILMSFLIIPMVSALDFDNSKKVLETKGLAGYKDIEINNWLGLGETLWSGTLDSNTEFCGASCQSTQTITLHKKGSLVDEVNFKTLQDDGRWKEGNIRGYQIYADNKLYNMGAEMDAGTYEVRLEGKKEPGITVDWIYKTNGETLNEWATWYSSNYTKGDWIHNVTMSGLHANPHASTSNNSDLWIIDQDDYAYNYVDGTYVDRFITSGEINQVSYGIALNFNNEKLFIGESVDDDVYIYHVNGTYNGTTIDLTSNIGSLFGIDLNETHMFALDVNSTISIWQIDGTYVSAFDITTQTGGSNTAYDIIYDKDEQTISTIIGIGDLANTGYVYKYYPNGSYISNWNATYFAGIDIPMEGLAYNDSAYFVIRGEGAGESIMAFERTDTSSGGRVTLNAPADNYESILSGVEFNATATIPGATLINMSLWHNATGTFELNQTNSTIDLTTNITTFDANFGVGEYSWNIQGCDSDGDCGFGESNRTIKIANLIENSQTYTSPTVEGTSNPFIVNVTYTSANWNVITGILTYNNTEYSGTKSGTGDTILFTSSTAAPNVDTQTNVTFYWTMGLTNASGTTYINGSTYNQTVNPINMSLCGNPYTVPFINFTFYDEQTFVAMNGSIELTFSYRQQDSTASNTFTYSDTDSNHTTFDFCIDPADETYTIDSVLEYYATGYAQRYYNFEGVEFTNTTTEIGLYLLDTGNSTSFLVVVQDENYQPIAGVEVYMQLYNPTVGTWNTVEISTTNDDGETINHIYTEDNIYRFKIYDDGELLHTTTGSVIACPSTPCTVTITISEAISAVLPDFEDLDNLDTSLTYDKTTDVITYTYSDTSGNFTQGRFYVIRQAFGESNILFTCNETSTSATAILTCDLTGLTNGTYIATGYITRTNELMVERKLILMARNIVDTLGLDGVLWSMFLLIGILMLGIYRPSLGIIFGIVGVILMSFLQLMELSITAIVALVGIGIILLVEVRKQ